MGVTVWHCRSEDVTPEMVLSPSSVRLLVFYLLLPGTLGRKCTSEETCTADCPQFQEDRRKLGTLPRKSSEYRELRTSLISQICKDQNQDDNEERVCCVRDNEQELLKGHVV